MPRLGAGLRLRGTALASLQEPIERRLTCAAGPSNAGALRSSFALAVRSSRESVAQERRADSVAISSKATSHLVAICERPRSLATPAARSCRVVVLLADGRVAPDSPHVQRIEAEPLPDGPMLLIVRTCALLAPSHCLVIEARPGAARPPRLPRERAAPGGPLSRPCTRSASRLGGPRTG